MKVTDVRCVVVPRERLPVGSVAMDLVIVRVLTDEGIEGNCFAWGGNHGGATARLIDALVKPQVVGEAPRYTERLWQRMRWRDRFGGHLPRYLYGPVDVALWDIGAKANLHVACAIPNCQYLELCAGGNCSFGLVEPPQIDREGYVHAPRRLGLGVEIDWKAIDALG